MAPRGLKAALKKTSPAKLTGAGKFRGYTLVQQGKKTSQKLKGITKRLQKRVWSNGVLPLIARTADPKPFGTWKGKGGGRLRGKKVDAQITRIVNAGPAAMKKASGLYKLSKMTLAGLAARGLEPVLAQREVASAKHRLGTAVDLVAYCKSTNRIVLVELKCGFDHGRSAPAVKGRKSCKMSAPLGGASDCVVNRHLAQLAATRELFVRETETLNRLGELGIEPHVDGALMYSSDSGVEFFELTEWWTKRAAGVIEAIA